MSCVGHTEIARRLMPYQVGIVIPPNQTLHFRFCQTLNNNRHARTFVDVTPGNTDLAPCRHCQGCGQGDWKSALDLFYEGSRPLRVVVDVPVEGSVDCKSQKQKFR